MGQFLATGLVSRMSVSKAEMQQGKITIEEIRERLEKIYYYDLSIFDEKEEDEYISWTINNKFMEEELISFLKEFLYRITSSSKNANDAIDSLEKRGVANWLEIAEEKDLYDFQIDEYGEREYMYFSNKDFRPTVKINFTCVMLSAEGKIMMEEYGRQFNFYKYCMIQAFSNFKIASALRVYITG